MHPRAVIFKITFESGSDSSAVGLALPRICHRPIRKVVVEICTIQLDHHLHILDLLGMIEITLQATKPDDIDTER